MALLSLPHLRPTHFIPNQHANLNPPRIPTHPYLILTLKASATPGGDRNATPPPPDFFRRLSVSSVVVLGLGLTSFRAVCPPAWARLPEIGCYTVAQLQDKQDVETSEDVRDIEDEEMKAAFERWKSKSYALTVPLKIVALEGSLPPTWIKEFLRCQGKRVKLQLRFRRGLHDIFNELSNSLNKEIDTKSAAAADLVTLGDSWLSFAIKKGLVEPMTGSEEQDWFRGLSDKWKVYLRRSAEGNLDSQGRVYAVPYRWGSIVIAYNKKEFRKHKLDPIEDWSDLWRPELAGKISMVDAPREIIGAVLKCMGASYNTTSIESQVAGGKDSVMQKLMLFVQQVRLFDSLHYLKAFAAGDVWVAVGWSSDVLPAAKRLSNIAVIVPKSGASLWADFWAVPKLPNIGSKKIGGRVRGPSPLVNQWVDFCLQPQRILPFKKEVIAGASPISLEGAVEQLQEPSKVRPKLDTNLIANVPPPEILSRCELLEPLPDDTLSDYQWLLNNLHKQSPSFVQMLQHSISSVLTTFWHKMQSKIA